MDSNKRGFANTEKRRAVFLVSFLVALMIDRVKSLRSLGVKCSMWSLQDFNTNHECDENTMHGQIYTSSAAIM